MIGVYLDGSPISTMEEIPHGDQGTSRTIEVMTRFAVEGARNPAIQDLARAIVRHAPSKDYLAEADAIFRWVQRNVRYTLDPRGLERVAKPEWTLFVEGAGDCDDHAVVVTSLALALGHGAAFKTVATDPQRSNQWSHVYAMIGVRDRSRGPLWVAADTTQGGAELGWEPPASRVQRDQLWVVSPP